MKVISRISDIRKLRKSLNPSARVGLVPTMGYLHAGHASLVQNAKKECDFVFSTVFVNPTQFGPKEDFNKYPRSFDSDMELLEKSGSDAVFVPPADEIYVPNHRTWLNVDGIDQTAEGRSRPNHFRGVATIVTKLFNICQPDKAYFGQKDAIQSILIRKMVKDLNFPIDVVVCPTVRDTDGLAMSSRNSYLSQKERATAPILNRALKAGENTYRLLRKPRRHDIIDACNAVFAQDPSVVVDYLSLASLETGEEILEERLPLEEGLLLSGVIKLGTTRLLDNYILAPK